MRGALRLAVLIAGLCPAFAFGQGGVLQGGPWTPGHAPMYSVGGSSQPVITDGGAARGGAIGVGLGELLVVARGTGTPPYVAQGTGAFGSIICSYDAPTTNPTGYHYLCISPNSQGGALFSNGAVGAQAAQPMQFMVNENLALSLAVAGITSGGYVRTAAATVAGLPVCNSAIIGARFYVTDALNPTFLGALTGGGTVKAPVFCNGTAWVGG